MPIRAPRVFTIPPGAPFLPTLSRALLDGDADRRLSRVGRPAGAGRGDDLRADPARRGGARRGAPRGERARRASCFRASRRSAPSSPTRLQAFAEPRRGRAAAAPALRPRSARSPAGIRSRSSSAAGARRCAARSAAPTRTALQFDDAEPALVASTPAQAYALAGDLAALIDDMIIEGVDPKALETLEPDAPTTPTGGSPSTSSRSPSPTGRNGWRSTASSTAPHGSRRWSKPRSPALASGARRRGPDDHRGLDRRQSRHRRA